MSGQLIGRFDEYRRIVSLYESDEAEFLALYGRRRIGKTFLVREIFSQLDCYFFEATGQWKKSQSTQLDNFSKALTTAFYPNVELVPPNNWKGAFDLLTDTINQLSDDKKVVIFLDELPWLAAKRLHQFKCCE